MVSSTIYHIDVNSAFLSWSAEYLLKEHMADVDIRTIPAVIGGDEKMRHGVVLAKSSPAKEFGIKTGEPLIRAREKCPGLKVFPPNHTLYTARSEEFISLLREVAPTVEQYSIDEAFCDMSGTENLYGNLTAYADILRERIYRELGFTVNIGVSTNKLLAKMASDFEKPYRTHTLFPEEIPAKMWPLPVGELFFVGKSTEKKLHTLGIHTIGDLAACDPVILTSHFHKQGQTIWNYANGRDLESVTGRQIANKGYSSETTLPADMTDPDMAKMILLSLAETVAARIRADKAYISVVGVTLVTCEFEKYSHQKSLFSPTNITEEIYQTAAELFTQMWRHEPIRLIGLSTGKATSDQTYQYDLFHQGQYERLSKLNSALDTIRDKYGSGAVKRACFLKDKD
ncbi:MAG: DNA polymerase IV [Lachnospiraceae bacterium]|nr:DNA polymerase IV [Lachnospiraceae bacterium]MDE6982142.1 DNA polymerase IV [Lachnospiraceae bacterium]